MTKIPLQILEKYPYAVEINAFIVGGVERWLWARAMCDNDDERCTNILNTFDDDSNSSHLILFRDKSDYLLYLLRWA